MKNVTIVSDKKRAFDVCSEALINAGCEIVSLNLETGEIEAKKGASLLSFGHQIILRFSEIKNNIEIDITSTSIGIQIFDWGTNEDNENEILQQISKMKS